MTRWPSSPSARARRPWRRWRPRSRRSRRCWRSSPAASAAPPTRCRSRCRRAAPARSPCAGWSSSRATGARSRWLCGWPTSSWTRSPSREARTSARTTSSAWRRPTRPSPTTAGRRPPVPRMRAIAVNEWGGADKLELLDDLEPPPVAPDGVLLRVRAAGVNPVDYKIREGGMAKAFPVHFPVILGWDAAGVVEEVGAAVTWFKPGDPVYGYCRRHELEIGTYGEYTTVPEGYLAHTPPALSFEEAGAMPLAVLTAHQGLE